MLAPNSPNPRFWKGLAHFYLDEHDMALPDLNSAMEKGYNKPLDVYLVRWRIHFGKKDFDSALNDVRSGLELDANNQDFLLARGDISFGKQAYKDAVDAYGAYIQRNPGNAKCNFRLAQATASGTTDFDRVLRKSDPSGPDQWRRSFLTAMVSLKMMFAEAVVAMIVFAVTAPTRCIIGPTRTGRGYGLWGGRFEKKRSKRLGAVRIFPNTDRSTRNKWYYRPADGIRCVDCRASRNSIQPRYVHAVHESLPGVQRP